jgi:hypothetical protein
VPLFIHFRVGLDLRTIHTVRTHLQQIQLPRRFQNRDKTVCYCSQEAPAELAALK